MAFDIATMSLAARQTTVTHQNKTLSPAYWKSIEVWSPGANEYVRPDRWEFTTPLVVGSKHQSTLTITGVDAADDAKIALSRGQQMRLRVGFGNNRREDLFVNITL